MRHAKAEQEGPTDFDRPLAERGRRAAAEAGAWLEEQGFGPDHALVSAARRTVETWSAVASGGGWELEPQLDRGLYSASPESAIDIVQLVDDEVSTLLVLGHNPTMGTLAALLDDGEGDPALSAEVLGGFPTSGVAVFSYDGAWSDLDEGTARLVAFHVGRD
jgi:phosphohistidine phosphatase